MKIGRNDPCPCGSGKKYKHCCLTADVNAPIGPHELQWRRLRQVLESFATDMLRFIKNAYGPQALDEGWAAFTLWEEEDGFDTGTPHMQVFMPWLFHCWSPDAEDTSVEDESLHEVTPTAAYLAKKGKSLDPLLRRYLEACTAAPFSFFEVVRCEPGRGMRLRDAIAAHEYEVMERSASQGMQPGDMLFGQVVQVEEDLTMLEACSGFVIPPRFKPSVIELRRNIGASEDFFAAELLREYDFELLRLYHDLFQDIFYPPLPQMQNTDGEALELRKLVFDIDSAQAAFDALKHLDFDETEQDLLEGAVRDIEGKLVRVSLCWKKQGNAKHKSWDNTILGRIEIDGQRLTAEVNSAKREKKLRSLIEKALGRAARHRATAIQSVEKLLAEVQSEPATARSVDSREADALAELPEVRAKLAEFLDQHNEAWVHEKLPVLGGKTPLEAMRDRDGREIVTALVQQIERDGARMSPPLDASVVRRLRERLGLAG